MPCAPSAGHATVDTDHARLAAGAATAPPGHTKSDEHGTPDALVEPAGQPKPAAGAHARQSPAAEALVPGKYVPAAHSVGLPAPAGQNAPGQHAKAVAFVLPLGQ
jgi:hypothetical protein